jgi:hypothetical protein
MPAGCEHASRLAQRGGWVGHQHVAPAAQHRIDAREWQVDPFGVEDLELDVLQPELSRPLTSPGDHRLGLVGDDHAAYRRDHLGCQHPCLADTGGEFQHALPRLQ